MLGAWTPVGDRLSTIRVVVILVPVRRPGSARSSLGGIALVSGVVSPRRIIVLLAQPIPFALKLVNVVGQLLAMDGRIGVRPIPDDGAKPGVARGLA